MALRDTKLSDPSKGSTSRRAGAVQLWAGWALPAAGWGMHLLLSHGLVEWYCNSRADLAPGSVQWLLRGITVVALVMALSGTWLAWRTLRTTGASSASTPEGRELQRFMAVSGLFLGVLFTGIVLVQGLPSLILEPCR